MFRYKGTKQLVKIGDTVRLSQRWALQWGDFGTVVGLNGFITVRTKGGDVDFNAQSITFVK